MTDDEETELCRTYEGRIRGYGLRHLRDAAAAEDLVQHVLMSVLIAARDGRIVDPARIGAYVLGTCRYAVRDFQRGAARQRKISEADPSGTTGVDRCYESSWVAIDRRRLERCLMELDERARAVVLATFAYEQDADEIGRVFAISPGNVRVIRHRALAKLQDCVGGAA